MSGRKTVQSVQRAWRIVELVARSDAGMTLSELADALGLQTNTTYYLADTLVQMRALDRTDRPRRYRLGPAVPELLAVHRRRERHLQLIEAVGDLAGRERAATISGFEVRAREMVMVARVGPPRRGIIEYPEMTMPPYTTASSLLHLATLYQEARTGYESRYPFADYGAGVWESREQLDRYLEKVHEQGYAAVPRDDMPQGRSVAVAVGIWSAGNQLEGALGHHGPSLADEDLTSAVARAVRCLRQTIAEHGLGERVHGEETHSC